MGGVHGHRRTVFAARRTSGQRPGARHRLQLARRIAVDLAGRTVRTVAPPLSSSSNWRWMTRSKSSA